MGGMGRRVFFGQHLNRLFPPLLLGGKIRDGLSLDYAFPLFFFKSKIGQQKNHSILLLLVFVSKSHHASLRVRTVSIFAKKS